MTNENRTRDVDLHLRFTEKEREFFEEIFEKSGYSNRTDFLIRLLKNSKIKNFYVDLSTFKNIQLNASRIGSNLNQIVRRIQTTDTMYKEDLEEIIKMQEILESIGDEFMEIKKLLPMKDIPRRK